jgi:hypothetical protein
MEKTIKSDNRPAVVFSQALIAEMKKIQSTFNPQMGVKSGNRTQVYL